MNINRVVISGNLTRDPELRQTTNGGAVLRLGVAVNERHKNQQTGQWDDYANFVDCTLFGNRAQALSQYLSKGTKVCIEGRLHWHSWQAKDGSTHSKLDVNVDEIEFMSRNQAPQQQPQYARPQPRQHQQPRQTNYTQDDLAGSVYDEDIPF